MCKKMMGHLGEYDEINEAIGKHMERNKDIKVEAEKREPKEDWE